MVHYIRNEPRVGGASVTATKTEQAGVFGKSRIVPGSAAVCIAQYQFGDKFQMITPQKDLVILRGDGRILSTRTESITSRGIVKTSCLIAS